MTHPLVGHWVDVKTAQGGTANGLVTRTHNTRFGTLARLADFSTEGGEQKTAWRVQDCTIDRAADDDWGTV